jgi:hypothetical protein
MAKHLKISFWVEDGPEFCPFKFRDRARTDMRKGPCSERGITASNCKDRRARRPCRTQLRGQGPSGRPRVRYLTTTQPRRAARRIAQRGRQISLDFSSHVRPAACTSGQTAISSLRASH